MARFFPLRNALARKVRTSLKPETRNKEDSSHKRLTRRAPFTYSRSPFQRTSHHWELCSYLGSGFHYFGKFTHNYYLYIYQEASGKEKLISCYKYGFCWSSVGNCVSTYIYFYPCNLPTVIAGKISRFSQNDYCCFRASLFYFCCFDICWEILRLLLAAEAPNTFYASIQACYFDGVVIGYPWFYFYIFSTKILKHSGFVFFTVFIRQSCLLFWLSAVWTSVFGESFSKKLFLITKTEPCKTDA